ncbi:MAG: 50S ribosomal protein L6 [Spirochaetales bacterium]|nr:50S ribosomal protein L6 [Spirochaetales bacterium]
MSRIGKMPVKIPEGVKVTVKKTSVVVEGPKGILNQEIRPQISVKTADDTVVVTRKNETKYTRSLHGLYRNLINNMVIGVSKGFSKTLLINGVGYRAEIKGENLVLYLGYSNPIYYPIPEGIKITPETNTKVVVEGTSKEQVGQISAEIRSFRPPEPYKGKGIRYEDEHVRRKIGKTGVK